MGHPDLRRALLERYPWLAEVDYGPRAVSAGECDRCGAEARMVAPCGPPPPGLLVRAGPDWALGRRCALELGEDLWCGGHVAEGAAARGWLSRLPSEADDIARLWWVATGEITVDPALRDRAKRLALPAPP